MLAGVGGVGDPVGLGWNLLVVLLYFACSYIFLSSSTFWYGSNIPCP